MTTRSVTKMPIWLLDATFTTAERSYHNGRITLEQWRAYRAIWRYESIRFSELVPDSECPRVRDAWATIDAPTPPTIAELVHTVKCADDEELIRSAARELHKRGVSIVGIIPTAPRKAVRPIMAHFDSIPSCY